MIRERLAGRAAAFECRDRGPGSGGIRLCTILFKVRLEVLRLHLELFDQPGMTFGTVAISIAPEFGDLEPQVPDHLLGGRDDGLGLDQFALGGDQSALRGRCAGLCRGKAARRTAISEGVSDMPKTCPMSI